MQNEIEISTLSVIELKALVYDKISLSEQLKREIDILNKEISLRLQQNAKQEVPTE